VIVFPKVTAAAAAEAPAITCDKSNPTMRLRIISNDDVT
jgi:hypothetical protein